MLFNLYLNDLAFSFDNVLSDPFVLPNGTRLNSLLYADDLIILSRSKLGLQNCLNVLSSYCNSWMLRINPKKTKIMIFQRCTRKCEHNFRIGNRPIRLTHCCTQFKPFGNKTFVSGISISFKCECHIIMQMQYTKNLIPGRFELGTTLR